MAKIRASCFDCGDVILTPDEFLVRLCADDNTAQYTFTCSLCGKEVAKEASPRIVEELVIAGVDLEVWRLPAELAEHPAKDAPRISEDDLLEFHNLLQQEDWFDRVVELCEADWNNP